jgi:hypothetical protein
MKDLPVMFLIFCVLVFVVYCAYIAFTLALENKGFQRFCASVCFTILTAFSLFIIYGLCTQDPDKAVYQKDRS